MLSSGFTPGTGACSSQPPRVTHLPRIEHKTRQGKQERQEIHPIPEEQEAPFSCFPPGSRDLGRSQGWLWATSPAQPSWEPGKAVVLLWQRASPSSERQDSQKKKHFTFPLGKSFCNISLVAWKSLAGSEGEIRGCTGWSHIKHHNSFGTSSLHLPHSSRTCGVQVSFPTVFCKTQSQGKRVPSLCHSTSSTWQPPGSPGCFCTHTPSLSWPGGF